MFYMFDSHIWLGSLIWFGESNDFEKDSLHIFDSVWLRFPKSLVLEVNLAIGTNRRIVMSSNREISSLGIRVLNSPIHTHSQRILTVLSTNAPSIAIFIFFTLDENIGGTGNHEGLGVNHWVVHTGKFEHNSISVFSMVTLFSIQTSELDRSSFKSTIQFAILVQNAPIIIRIGMYGFVPNTAFFSSWAQTVRVNFMYVIIAWCQGWAFNHSIFVQLILFLEDVTLSFISFCLKYCLCRNKTDGQYQILGKFHHLYFLYWIYNKYNINTRFHI